MKKAELQYKAKLAGMWCNDPEFWRWLASAHACTPQCADDAAERIYSLCNITSRAELDHDEEAAEIFHREIRGPFSKYMQANG